MICSKHIDVKRYCVCFQEIEKHLLYLFGFEFIRFSNRGVLSAASCSTAFELKIILIYEMAN